MPLPLSKKELLQHLESAYSKLDLEFDAVTTEYEKMPNLVGDVSCCDVVAYQIGWGKLLMSWEESELSDKSVEMPSADFKWNQLGLLADSFYEEYDLYTLKRLRGEFFVLQEELVQWINALENAELFEPGHRKWTGDKWAMVKWIQINTIAPYKSARTKVRRWKREQGI